MLFVGMRLLNAMARCRFWYRRLRAPIAVAARLHRPEKRWRAFLLRNGQVVFAHWLTNSINNLAPKPVGPLGMYDLGR